MTESDSGESLPLVPFDPRETGPHDVARSAGARLQAFASDNSLALILGWVLLIIAAWHYNVSLPKIPNWMLVGIGGIIFMSPWALIFGWFLGSGLSRTDTVVLSLQNPTSGDQRLVHVAPERFQDMSVFNLRGQEREREFLSTVFVNGHRAYEVDDYDEDANVAIASSMAGRSNSDVRRDRKEIRHIKTDLEREADKAIELLVNHSSILREQGAEVANRIVKVAEEVDIPEGGRLHETLNQKLEEADPSDELLDDGDRENERQEQLGNEDIFQRAQALAQSNGHQEEVQMEKPDDGGDSEDD